MTDIVEQIIGTIIAIAIALGGCVAYFWGTNWLLDKLLSTNDATTGAEMTRRDSLRSQIRPWLFLAPALLFLSVYLIYPVIETFRLSFFDKTGGFTADAFGSKLSIVANKTDMVGVLAMSVVNNKVDFVKSKIDIAATVFKNEPTSIKTGADAIRQAALNCHFIGTALPALSVLLIGAGGTF